jgi:oxygen-independent coproporphyrinogen-3 oxidase
VIEQEHGIDFDCLFAAELRKLEPLAGDGLVDLLPERIEVTPRGRFIVRNVAMVFDAHLGKQPDVQYSRTV